MLFNKQKKDVNHEKNNNAINKLQKNREYQKNKNQIEIITKVLVEHADVPQELIDTLIKSVKENTTLEQKAQTNHN